MKKGCEAREYTGYNGARHMGCERCRQAWDLADPSPPKCKPNTAPDLLGAAAETFRGRNAVYGDNYKRGGVLLLALFPPDGIPAIKTEEDAQRLRLITLCSQKLQRYCYNFTKGGHRDSAHDLIVYAAMLEEFTNE